MMNRTAALTLVIAMLALVAFAVLGRDDHSVRPDQDRGGADSVWYYASDVAQLARAGRPQLVEFFHPG